MRRYFPTSRADSVFSIPYDKLLEQGVTGLIFDIDNTLVPHGADSTEEVDALFRRLHDMGFKTLLLSNNSEARILRFIRHMDTLYVCDANKPHPGGYLRAMEMLSAQPHQVVMIGDQVFTDIRGANAAGIQSILVKYIGHERWEWKGFRRYLEWLILLFRPLLKR